MKFNSASILLAGMTCIFALTACSPSRTNQFESQKQESTILGGTVVSPLDTIARSTVAILISVLDGDQSYQFLCTGTLIRNNMVLTAAHCAVPSTATRSVRSYIIFGNDVSDVNNREIRSVTDQVPHPRFADSAPQGADANDVAVMKFAGTLPDNYRMARILPNESFMKKDMMLTIAGYGMNDLAKGTTDSKLHKVDLPYGQDYGSTEVILDQTGGRGACHGDSGGPVYVSYRGATFLWAVTSRGLGAQDDCSTRGVYTKVNAQIDFINCAINQLSDNSN